MRLMQCEPAALPFRYHPESTQTVIKDYRREPDLVDPLSAFHRHSWPV